MRAILDTSVVIAHDVPKLHGELAISVATLAELHFSVLVTNSPMIRRNACDGSPSCSTASRRYPSMTR